MPFSANPTHSEMVEVNCLILMDRSATGMTCIIFSILMVDVSLQIHSFMRDPNLTATITSILMSGLKHGLLSEDLLENNKRAS